MSEPKATETAEPCAPESDEWLLVQAEKYTENTSFTHKLQEVVLQRPELLLAGLGMCLAARVAMGGGLLIFMPLSLPMQWGRRKEDTRQNM